MDISFKIREIYQVLLNKYDKQGWWPYLDIGYHPNDYTFPKTQKHIFEIYLGVILTQNTTFNSVQKSLENLKQIACLEPQKFLNENEELIKKAIKPSGYFNQKYQYILNIITFITQLDSKVPTREELLSIKGIGQESADTILLYAYKKPEFVIDAYTRRIVIALGFADEKTKYKELKRVFEKAFENEKNKPQIFQEYHALLVEHAKRHYSKKPYGIGCFLTNFR